MTPFDTPNNTPDLNRADLGTYILVGHVPVYEPDHQKWLDWNKTHPKEKRVAETWIDDVRVSTVFLGLDHRIGAGVPLPLLFETMIFGGGQLDQYGERCSTWQQALGKHESLCNMVKLVKKEGL